MSLLISNTNGQAAAGLVQTTAVGAVNLRASHSICMRIRFTSQPTNIDVVPVAFTADATLSGTWMERRNGDAGGAFFAKRWNAAQTLNDQASIGGYTTGWQHMVVTYNATSIRTYLNGAQVATTASATTRTDSTTSCRIFIGFGGQYVITDVGFFGRQLTLQEIEYLRSARQGMVISRGDCFGWYPLFRDNYRQDWSGRGNDLDDFAGTGTAPAADNEDPGVGWGATRGRRLYLSPGTSAAVDGDGRTVFNGSGAQTAAVAESADGRTVFNGSGARSVAAAETADGRTLFNGSGAPTLAVATSADGRTLFNGSGTASTSGDVNATGDGRTLLNGAGTLTAAVSGVGDGRTAFNGSAVASLGFAVAGDGRTAFNGAASATVAASASGDGRTLFNGAGDAQVPAGPLPPQARGSGRRTTWIWTNPLPQLTYATAFSNDRLLEYWHSEQGISIDGSSNVQTWTGQLRGLQLAQPTAGQRPTYGADSTFFNGKNVVQCATTGARLLFYQSGPNIFSVTDRFAVMHVSRFRTVPSAFRASAALSGAGVTMNESLRTGPIRTVQAVAGPNLVMTEPGAPTTSPRLTVFGRSSTELETWGNGQKLVGAGLIGNFSSAPTKLVVGAFDDTDPNPADLSAAMVFLLRSMPTQFEQLQIYELAKTEWGI